MERNCCFIFETEILNSKKMCIRDRDKMSDEELCEAVKTVNIFSRVIPEHKMRIVRAFQKNGNIVAIDVYKRQIICSAPACSNILMLLALCASN